MREIKIVANKTQRTNSYESYMASIPKKVFSSPEEEYKAFVALKADPTNKALKQVIIDRNLLFVVSVAKKYQGYEGNANDLMDLIQAGNIGMIKAIDRFDETRGFKFISYAVNWIRQSIMHFIEQNSTTIKMPTRKIIDKLAREKFISQFIQLTGQEPTNEDLLNFNIPVNRDIDTVSLSIPAGYNLNSELADSVEDKTFAVDTDLSVFSNEVLLNDLLSKLTEKEAGMLKMRFGIGSEKLHFKDIGKQYGLTGDGARNNINQSLIKLRRLIEKEKKKENERIHKNQTAD